MNDSIFLKIPFLFKGFGQLLIFRVEASSLQKQIPIFLEIRMTVCMNCACRFPLLRNSEKLSLSLQDVLDSV